MKKPLLLILLLLSNTLQASTEKPRGSLTIVDVDPAIFFAKNFWETPAGKAFWQTQEGKTVLQIMFEYRIKMEDLTKP